MSLHFSNFAQFTASHGSSTRNTIENEQKSRIKTRLIVFFDFRGIILVCKQKPSMQLQLLGLILKSSSSYTTKIPPATRPSSLSTTLPRTRPPRGAPASLQP
ncbi:hypothetical protein J6590_081439 [Homalodisca vitripennis]|nr:hypothetical protein J6590_081439 [Homalodisca vitripennis]